VTGVTVHEYYVRRAVECALAAESIPCDRDVLLHMAATYFRIAAEIEMRRAHGGFVRSTRVDAAEANILIQPANRGAPPANPSAPLGTLFIAKRAKFLNEATGRS
jgi:hypothetical protein